MGEFDSIDDELFSLDYRSQRRIRHASLSSEPPTVRLRPRTLDRPSERDDDYSGETAIVIGLAVLLVVVIATAGLVLWWWA
jgi:hypothetical protein